MEFQFELEIKSRTQMMDKTQIIVNRTEQRKKKHNNHNNKTFWNAQQTT